MQLIEMHERPRPGEYFSGDRELFRVEEVFDGRALIEDCRTGALLDVAVGELSRLRRVERRAPSRSARAPAER